MCGPHFCSMKTTEDVRKYAAEQNLSEYEVLAICMKEKSGEFTAAGRKLYSNIVPLSTPTYKRS